MKAWQKFWKKVFEYIIKNNLPAYDVFFYVLTVPSILHSKAERAPQIFKEIEKQLPIPAAASYRLLQLSIILLDKAINYYVTRGKIPSRYADGLMFLYNLIMTDFSEESGEYSLQEVLKAEENMTATKIQPRSWFVINSIVRDLPAEPVKTLIEVTRREEEESRFSGEAMIDPVVESYLAEKEGGLARRSVEKILKDFVGRIPEDEVIAKALGGKLEGEKLVLRRELGRFLYATVLYYAHARKKEAALQTRIETLSLQIEEMKESFSRERKRLLEQIEELKAKLQDARQAKVKREKIYVDRGEEIERLKREQKRMEAELREQISMWQEIAQRLQQELQEAEEKEKEIASLPKPIEIAYFGKESPQLKSYLEGYNIKLRFYSPFSPPENVPDLPAVLNVDAASHKVYFKIKKKDPLLVSGSNYRRLALRILKWIKKKYEV